MRGQAGPSLAGRRLLFVISGGIAAYKVPFALRALAAEGAALRVCMTPGALQFMGAATFEALTGAPVLTQLFGAPSAGAIDHVELAQWPEQVVVAPASASLLARMAHGLASDAASAVLLATRAPVLVAPAMNDGMWAHPATAANVQALKGRGVEVIGPDEGFLAEGYAAIGRMVEPEALVDALRAKLAR